MTSLKRAEESRRGRAWNPRGQWKAMQEAMAWTEAQVAVMRNTPAGCLRKERVLPAGLSSAKSPWEGTRCSP